jgi:hypothetical protein
MALPLLLAGLCQLSIAQPSKLQEADSLYQRYRKTNNLEEDPVLRAGDPVGNARNRSQARRSRGPLLARGQRRRLWRGQGKIQSSLGNQQYQEGNARGYRYQFSVRKWRGVSGFGENGFRVARTSWRQQPASNRRVPGRPESSAQQRVDQSLSGGELHRCGPKGRGQITVGSGPGHWQRRF